MKFVPIKILLKGGSEHEITEVEYGLLCSEFPRVEVPAELAKMAAWCRANPHRRKTARGISRFITAWLSRAKERAPKPGVTYAAAHRPFGEEEKTPEEVKAYANRELARMQALIEKRAIGEKNG